jgi:hypothetical protein
MADSVSSLLTVEIKGGPPKISAAHNVTVEAYERIQVSLPGADDSGKKPVTLNLLPAGSTAKILAITSSRYGEGLTYKGSGTEIPLDGPQLFTGGSVQLLGKVETLTLTNALGAGKDATVTILVGRDVVPPAPKSETPAQPAAQPANDTKAAQPAAQPVSDTKAAQPPTTPNPPADATAAAAKTKQPADANVQPAAEQAPKK